MFRNPIYGLLLISLLQCGCNKPPSLYPVSGQVTLDGKAYDRLIVYLRPIGSKVNQFNLGVGETDSSGALSLRSSAGNGLAAGEYRASFSCIVIDGQTDSVGLSDTKQDDNRTLVTKDLVPSIYADDESSPVRFEVTAVGENRFVFDIPPN